MRNKEGLGGARSPNATASGRTRCICSRCASRRGRQRRRSSTLATKGTAALCRWPTCSKLGAYHHFIKRQQIHRDAFGVDPIRAVLVETTDEPRARKLMHLASSPPVVGSMSAPVSFGFSPLPSLRRRPGLSRAAKCPHTCSARNLFLYPSVR